VQLILFFFILKMYGENVKKYIYVKLVNAKSKRKYNIVYTHYTRGNGGIFVSGMQIVVQTY